METDRSGPDRYENPTARTCRYCQASGIPTNAKYCAYCGSALHSVSDTDMIICPNCSYSNPSKFKFCAHCGLSFTIQPKMSVIDDFSKPSSREHFLATDGLFPEEEKGGIAHQLLPALFVLMISALGLLAVIFGILILAPFNLDADDESTSLILQIFADIIPLAVLLTPAILSRFGLTGQSIGLKEDLRLSLAFRVYLALTLIVMATSLMLTFFILLPIYAVFDTQAEETSPYPDVSFLEPDFLLLWIFVAVIIGPIYEEVLARGYLIPLLEKRGASPAVAILGSSAIFSGLHLQADLLAMFDEGSTIGAIEFPISHAVSTFVIGLVFGTIYYASGRSLKTCILLHSINNGVATIILASGDVSESTQLWLAFFLFLGAILGGGYVLYSSRHLLSQEFSYAKSDLQGFETAGINYIATICFMALIPIFLLFVGGFLAYLAWYGVGGGLFVLFLYKTRKQRPTIAFREDLFVQ